MQSNNCDNKPKKLGFLKRLKKFFCGKGVENKEVENKEVEKKEVEKKVENKEVEKKKKREQNEYEQMIRVRHAHPMFMIYYRDKMF